MRGGRSSGFCLRYSHTLSNFVYRTQWRRRTSLKQQLSHPLSPVCCFCDLVVGSFLTRFSLTRIPPSSLTPHSPFPSHHHLSLFLEQPSIILDANNKPVLILWAA